MEDNGGCLVDEMRGLERKGKTGGRRLKEVGIGEELPYLLLFLKC